MRISRRGIAGLVAAGAAVGAPVALASGGTHTAAPVARIAAGGGQAIRGAIHNPPRGNYVRTTGVFTNSNGWGTRLENFGTGGETIVECHAPAKGLPCLDSYNISTGLAFLFDTSGTTGGEILLSNPAGAPFTTNAHGVATGLNANYLQGKQASEFQLAAKPAADSEKLAGQPASAYVAAGQLLFANVAKGSSGPTLQSTRGATAVKQSGSQYTVTFGTTNISKCSFTASPQGAALTTGQLGVASSTTSLNDVIVSAPTGFEGGFDLQVVC